MSGPPVAPSTAETSTARRRRSSARDGATAAAAAVALLAALGVGDPAPAGAAERPEPPRVRVELPGPGIVGRAVAVGARDNLQTALDRAEPGDVLMLQEGATFVGPFTLPRKSGQGWITIRTDTPDHRLPAPGVRITPAYTGILAKLESAKGSVIVAAPGAHHYRFVGVEIRPKAGTALLNVVQLGSGEPLEMLPSHFVFERCYLHGDAAKGSRRGIALNSRHTAVVDSYLADFKEVGADSQAIAGWAGPGPFKIVNNYLEGAGENVMFGGADPITPQLVPSDIEVRYNHVAKPLAWKIGEPAFQGVPWGIKNLLELKNARRVLIEGNLFEQSWAHAQRGFAVLFTVRNDEGRAPWAVVEDVTFVNNVVRRVGGAIAVLGHDDNFPSDSARRLRIANNLFEEVGGPRWQGPGTLAMLLEGAASVTIENNTALQAGPIIVAEGVPHRDFAFRNNIVLHNAAGIAGSGTGVGKGTLDTFFPGAVVRRNVIVGGAAGLYPADNFFPAAVADVGFANPAAGHYALAARSPYRRAATDGRDVGADVAALAAALAGRAPSSLREEKTEFRH